MGLKRGKIDHGEMAEWSIAAVLKTVELRGSGGSNPSLSAEKERVQITSDLHPFYCIHRHSWKDFNIFNSFKRYRRASAETTVTVFAFRTKALYNS